MGSTSLSLRLCFASKSTDSYASVELQSVSMSLRCCMGDIEAFDRRTRGGVPSTEFHVARSRSPFIPLIQKKAAAAPTRFYSSDARSKYLADATRYHFLPSAQKASPKRSRQSARARHSMRATIRIEMERKGKRERHEEERDPETRPSRLCRRQSPAAKEAEEGRQCCQLGR